MDGGRHVRGKGYLRALRHRTARAAARWRGPAAGAWASSLDQAAYVRGVGQIRAAIADGIVCQANLCRILSAPLPAAETAETIEAVEIAGLGARLARGTPAPYAATISLPGMRIASASPELYLSRRGEVVESRRSRAPARTAADLQPKDRADNVMIVDLVRNDLGRVADVGSVSVPELCVVERHPSLVHLVSTVRARLASSAGWPELLAATFPPGSVTGAPKSSARTLLDRLEPVPRGPYCGAIGWVDAESRRGAIAVGIRTFWIEAGKLIFGTGAGITWGSEPYREWEENRAQGGSAIGGRVRWIR